MTTLLILGLMFIGALCSLILIPLVLLKVVFALLLSLIVIPFKILGALIGGLTRGFFKGIFLLAILMIPLTLVALPFAILGLFGWLVYRAFRPRRPPQAYMVA
jgi:hypothetical protein